MSLIIDDVDADAINLINAEEQIDDKSIKTNSIGDVDAYAINLDIDHEETSYVHDTDRSSSITDSKGGIPSLREPVVIVALFELFFIIPKI